MTGTITPHQRIKAWSLYRLKTFESCPYRLFLEVVGKQEGPPRDDKHPMVRGLAIHKEAEQFVKGELAELPQSLKKVERYMHQYRDLYVEYPDDTFVEEKWGFDKHWAPTEYFSKDVWLRMSADFVWLDREEQELQCVDYKTGKSFGNEVAHIQQGQLYSISAFMRFPEVDAIRMSFLYVDEGKEKAKVYMRDKMIPYIERFTDRALRLTSAMIFPPKPNRMNCKYCPYGVDHGTNACAYAVGPT